MKQLNEFETIEAARSYTYTTERMISSAMIFAMLGQHNSMNTLKASDDNVAVAFLSALNGGVDEYNLMNSHDLGELQQSSLARLVGINAVTQEFANAAIAYANGKIEQPYLDCTQVQFNNAKKLYTEIPVTDYQRGKNLKVTLIDTLPESCAITTWDKDGDFGYEYFGKAVHVNKSQNVYKLKLDNKAVDGELFVRIPFENFNFTVEMT